MRWIKISLTVLATTIILLGLWAFWWEPAGLHLHEETIIVPWPRPPLRAAILTDIHIGSPYNDLAKLKQIVAQTNAAQPDLICILGDLVIHGVVGGTFVPPEPIAQELANLHAPLGVVSVLGNHDYWANEAQVTRALHNNGIFVLSDSAMTINTLSGPIWIVGVSDFWAGKHDVINAMQFVSDDNPVIAITHNPDIFPKIPARVNVTFAGHTHGGQVCFPIIGAPIVPSWYGQRFVAGHIVESGRHLYVATGTGTSILPVRFRVPPKIEVVTLRER